MSNNGVNLSDDTSDEDDSNWQAVTKKRKTSRSPIGFLHKRQQIDETATPSTSNRFSALAANDKESNGNNSSSQPTEPKPPPIFIPNVDNIGKMISCLSKVIANSDFNFKCLRDGQVRLMTKTIESYRKVVRHFESSKICYHTFQLKKDRAYRVVIKGLHHSTAISDIKAKLLSLGHQVRSVRNVISRKTKEPLSMFFVDLDPSENNKDVYNIHSIDNAIFTVEPPKRFDDIVQCFRCQEYGHTKSYCRKPFRCVKCGLDHSTTECTKPANTPAKCVHCLSNHTASYKGCLIYQKLVSNKNNSNNRYSNERTIYNPSNVNHGQNQYENINASNAYTYSQAVRGEQPGENNLLNKIEAMLAKQIELTNTLMNMMSMLMSKLCK